MTYRPEIDGLRAIAVMAVILFHAGFSYFSGGFVGVDVFFVISGYLITNILVNDLHNERFSLLAFYERRARRILPALFLVVAVSMVFAQAWMVPSRFVDFSESALATVLFVANFYFWQTANYFEAAAEFKPLLHTWSLAVEEQYYLFFPVFLLLVWRYARRLLWPLMGLAAVASLALAEVASNVSPVANFFLAPTRAWEFLVGSFCAYLLRRGHVPRHGGLAALGLALVVVSILVYDRDTPFPSLYALVPVGGTALILLFGGAGTWVGSLLASRAFVGVGLISYSAYLWHQPVFAFARIRALDELDIATKLVLIAAVLALSYLSWRWVEEPFRRRRIGRTVTPRGALGVSGGSTAALAAVAGLGMAFPLAGSTLTAEQRYYASFLDYRETTEFVQQWRVGTCFYAPEDGDFRDIFDIETCLEPQSDKPILLLMGDSYAAQLWLALSESFADYEILQATAAGCRPLVPYRGQPACLELVDYVFEEFLPNERVAGVIIAANWSPPDLDRLPGTIQRLKSAGIPTFVVGVLPEFRLWLPEILSAGLDRDIPIEEWAATFLEPERFEFEAALRAAAADAAVYMDVMKCTRDGDSWRVLSSTGEPLVFDQGHYTLSGSRDIAACLAESYGLRVQLALLDAERKGTPPAPTGPPGRKDEG